MHGEHFGRSMKVKEVVSLHKKKPLFLEAFCGFTEASVSLFPLFQLNLSYTRLYDLSYISFLWEGVSNISYL